MTNSRCSCEYCTQDRRRETDRLLGQSRQSPRPVDLLDLWALVFGIFLPLLILGMAVAWLVGR